MTRDFRTVSLSGAKGVQLNGALLDTKAGEGADAKWVHVATAGEYRGYGGGPDHHPGFTFDRKTFEEVIANIHSHPSFKLGISGFGEDGVIPWDFHHASEAPANSGTIPTDGAPARAWSSDGQIRNGATGAELWMLTKFLEPARGYVLAGSYKWASVALSFESVDAVTGKPTGALVTSIALTNNPFIEGMAQLAATTNGAPGAPDNGAVQAAKETAIMDILKVLAALLGVPATQEAITAEMTTMLELRSKLIALFAMPATQATTGALLQAATDANAGAEVMFSLVAALKAKDGADAVGIVADLQASHAELEKLKPAMLALQKVQDDAEALDVAADVDRALASNAAFGDDMREMFTLSRKAGKDAFLVKYPRPEPGVVVAAVGAAPNAAVLQASVAATTAGVQLAVAPTVAAVPAVGLAGVTVDSAGNITRPVAAVAAAVPAVSGVLGGQQVNLAHYPGVTDQQRMIAHLTATRPGFEKQTWEEKCEAAFLALKVLKGAA